MGPFRKGIGGDIARHRSFNRYTNFSPDQTSSTAQTFTSTNPFLNPISRTTFSFKSVFTLEAPLGQEIQSVPASSRFFLSLGKAESRTDLSVVKNWMKSQGPFNDFAVVAWAGSSPNVLSYPAGALPM